MKIAIVDDDKAIHSQIRNYITGYFRNDTVAEIFDEYSGEALLKADIRFDIIFIDIEMGEINGIDCAEELRKKYPDIIIIFVSSHKEYVFDAFRCEALHYIVKPLTDMEFNEIFTRAVHKYQLLNNFFPVKYKNNIVNLRVNDIMYIEISTRRLLIHTADKILNHSGRLYKAYKALAPHGFVYIHQGCIVNMHYIERFEQEYIELTGGEKISISVRKRPDALAEYGSYLSKWSW